MIKYPNELTEEQHLKLRDHLAHIWHHIDEINEIIKDVFPKSHRVKQFLSRLDPRKMHTPNQLETFRSALDNEWCKLNHHKEQITLIYYKLDKRIKELYDETTP